MQTKEKRLYIFRPVTGDALDTIDSMQRKLRKAHTQFIPIRSPHVTLGVFANPGENTVRRKSIKIGHILAAEASRGNVTATNSRVAYFAGHIAMTSMTLLFESDQIETEKRRIMSHFDSRRYSSSFEKHITIGRIDPAFATKQFLESVLDLCPGVIDFGPMDYDTNSTATNLAIKSVVKERRSLFKEDDPALELRPFPAIDGTIPTVRPGTVPRGFLDSIRPA